VLAVAGFDPYEVSNHARGAASRSRHNLIYWRGEDYLGVGPGAHGRMTDATGARRARLTAKKVADYVARVSGDGDGLVEDEPLSAADVALERLLMGLRTLEGVADAELAPLAIDPVEIGSLVGVGLLQQAEGRLVATRRGRAVLDRITLELARNARAG
jgi:oxygen-independent coproporphyrinogen-3 oxidase